MSDSLDPAPMSMRHCSETPDKARMRIGLEPTHQTTNPTGLTRSDSSEALATTLGRRHRPDESPVPSLRLKSHFQSCTDPKPRRIASEGESENCLIWTNPAESRSVPARPDAIPHTQLTTLRTTADHRPSSGRGAAESLEGP